MRRLALYIIAGALLAVAMAWLAEVRVRADSVPFFEIADFSSALLGPTDRLPAAWPEPVPDDWPNPKWRWHRNWPTISVTALGTDPHWQPRGDGSRSGVLQPNPSLNQRVQFVLESGFPLRCLRSVHTFGLGGQDLRDWRSGVPIDRSHWPPRPYLDSFPPLRLPVEILWFGMLFDAAVYSLLVAALHTIARFLIRRIRERRNGVCARCRYRIANGGGCPECGFGGPA